MRKTLLVDRSNIAQITEHSAPAGELDAGQVRLALQSFALTANNVTYAATGDQIGYWQFFPSGIEGQGIVPVWGTAVVTESRAEDMPVGRRYYGFYPMAEELVIQAAVEEGGTVFDAAPHRAKLPPIYNRYYPVTHDPCREDDLRALLQPLLATGYLLADWLYDNDWFGAEQIIVGSASSKTAIGLCTYLQEYADRPFRIIGLTSAGNAAFVEKAGTCDTVVGYDDIEKLAVVASVYVDMAGNADVKRRLHAHLDQALKFSSAVGISHWDKFAPPQDLAGPKPEFFFAPSQSEKRRAEWGAQVIDRKISEAWKRVADRADDWLQLRHHDGLNSAIAVYQDLAGGAADPRDGHVVQLAANQR